MSEVTVTATMKLNPCPICKGKSVYGVVKAYSSDSSYMAIHCENKCGLQYKIKGQLTKDEVDNWNSLMVAGTTNYRG